MGTKPATEKRHPALALVLVIVVLAAGLVYLFLNVDFIPDAGARERELIDGLVRIQLAIGSVIFVTILLLLAYAVIFFRRRPGDDSDAQPIRGHAALEIAWTIIPLIIVVALSIHGANVLDEMGASEPALHAHGQNDTQTYYSLGAFVPGEAGSSAGSEGELVIDVTASRYLWAFAYPQYGIEAVYELRVPVDRRIVLNLHSTDVIHSFYVREWGPKQDAVPGLSPVLRITPTQIGEYKVECSQLCGAGHTAMTAPVRVVSDADFASWIQQQAAPENVNPPPAETHVVIELVARDSAFDKDTITVPAGVHVMIDFDNQDIGVPYNFALYTTPAATEPIFIGPVVDGPQRTIYPHFAAPPAGEYFFCCDAYADRMAGTFVVK
jgi:cytochrome c oxidase subunit 2